MHCTRYICLGIFTIILLCFIPFSGVSEEIKEVTQEASSPDVQPSGTTAPEYAWLSELLTDVVTGEQFTLQELSSKGKPIIMHSFAVWCPGCTMQLKGTTKLMNKNPDSYIMVGLDIDPNENSGKVKSHVEKNQFAGIFATAPREMTKSLVDAYGPRFALEIPQTIIVCNKSSYYMGSGVYSEDTLKEAASELC